MKVIEVVAVAIRMLGILLLFILARDISKALLMAELLYVSNEIIPTILHYGVLAVYLTTAILMVKFPVMIANYLVSISDTKDRDQPLLEENGEAIQLAGLTLMGVYILTWAIPDLLNNALMLFAMRIDGEFPVGYLQDFFVNEVVTLLEIAIGLYLVLTAKGIIRIIQKLRS